MERFIKVECLRCGEQYYIPAYKLPQEKAEILDAAFPSRCPFCEDSDYAVLTVPNELKKRK